MTPREIVDALLVRGSLSESRKKDVLTSLRKLADAAEVSLENLDLARIDHTYQDLLKAYFAHVSPSASVHTQRNTFQNLAQLYTRAYEANILRKRPLVETHRSTREESRQAMSRESPYRVRTSGSLSRYQCRKDEWPVDIAEHWGAYCAEKRFEVRDTTLAYYEKQLLPYLSYAVRFGRPPIERWDQLFEVARLRQFIQWHCARVDTARDEAQGHKGPKTRITRTGVGAVEVVAILARYLKREDEQTLTDFYKKLPIVEPMHHKTDPVHTITPRELEDVGLALLDESRQPIPGSVGHQGKYPGKHRAITCQTGLMIRLWWRVPIRSRCMRELDIARIDVHAPQPRLYQDEQKVWQLRYQGEQLKVGERRGRPNEFRVPFPPDLVPHLEEYLAVFRPMMPNADRDPHLFLSCDGFPLSGYAIWSRLAYPIYHHLGRRIYPHLLRTIWADMYLLASGGDIDAAAYMLNDNPATVLQHYHELRADQQVIKAYAFNEAILGNGKANGKRKTP